MILFLFFVLAVRAQTEESIIYLDFQDWTATEGAQYDPPDSCEGDYPDLITGPEKISIDYETGGHGQVTLVKYYVSPLCNCKKVNRGDLTECGLDITTGWVALAKVEEETDTIGEFILPKLSNVTAIAVGFSCTGSNRGFRLYASTDDGVSWGDPIGGEHWEADAQTGVLIEEAINMDDVILKITSGTKDDGTSQYTRLHNVEVWGVPGWQETGVSDPHPGSLSIYYRAGKGLVIDGEVKAVSVYDITGRLLRESHDSGSRIMTLPELSDGVYFARVTDPRERVYTRKFVIR